ncbi:MAG: M18 family aminopeptidase [Atopobiaceae bacterium]|nr:M18 family aminopeptidase [Atopobiaceae bacterium]
MAGEDAETASRNAARAKVSGVGDGEATEHARALCEFVGECPSPYHTVLAIRARLEACGFVELSESATWNVLPGGKYFVVRNDSSIIAFAVGSYAYGDTFGFKVAASHSDSPTYKIKAEEELGGPGPYVRLNVEGYGGMIDRTWLDRPLGVAGRVLVRQGNVIRRRFVDADEDLVLIPSLAVHLNRDVNTNGALNRQVDMCPLFSAAGGPTNADGFVDFGSLLADRLDVAPEDVLGHDLVLVNRQAPTVWGANREFLSAPRLDDLQCVYSSLEAFVGARDDSSVLVFACLNNEEVGSGSMQGALSTVLPDVMRRASLGLSVDPQAYIRAVSRSFMVSCDNAQAVHPNHAELYDEGNRVWLNGGVVVKEAANQKYCTDAVGRAIFEELCRRAGVPVQRFANRSDMTGGSTLGNLAQRRVSMHALDVGLPQLAMHSAYETAGVLDTVCMVRALREFYDTRLTFGPDGSIAFG